jgi:methylated-DNA-[protein]-cysteine S-methyltransferase
MDDLERQLSASAGALPAQPSAQLDRSLVARAEREGLLDVAYALTDTPLGEVLLAATAKGLARVAYPVNDHRAVLDDLARRLSPRVLEAPARLDRARRQLDEYFSGRRKRFELPLDLSLTRGFSRRVLDATAAIGFGEQSTYRQVARAAGSERAARAAGNALGANPIPVVVPCHRVLHSGGGLGGYTGGLERKRFLLEVEGVDPDSLQ